MTYRYVPAQQEMAEEQKWLYTQEGREWLDARTNLWGNHMANGVWLCTKDVGRKENIYGAVRIERVPIGEIGKGSR